MCVGALTDTRTFICTNVHTSLHENAYMHAQRERARERGRGRARERERVAKCLHASTQLVPNRGFERLILLHVSHGQIVHDVSARGIVVKRLLVEVDGLLHASLRFDSGSEV